MVHFTRYYTSMAVHYCLDIILAWIVPDIFGPDHGDIRLGSVVLVRFGVTILVGF